MQFCPVQKGEVCAALRTGLLSTDVVTRDEFLRKQKTETIQELQRELQKLQKDSLMAGEELAPNRYHHATSRERLCPLRASRDTAAAAREWASKPRAGGS